MRRQQLLAHETPPRYRALLDEAVLHRQVGGPAVMEAQLDRLLESADGQVIIQVIPFDVGALASTDSNFDFLEFGENSSQKIVVFVEGLFSNRYQERPIEIERYREAIEYLRDAALNPRESANLINKIQSTRTHDQSKERGVHGAVPRDYIGDRNCGRSRECPHKCARIFRRPSPIPRQTCLRTTRK